MKIVDVRIVRKNEKHDVDEARGHPIIFQNLSKSIILWIILQYLQYQVFADSRSFG